VPVGIFPKLPEERSTLLFRAKAGGRGTHPELPGKGEGETEGWGKREFPGSMHEGLMVITAVQVDPTQRQYWSIGSKRGPPLLVHVNHEGSIRDLIVFLSQTWLEESES
jgi:hypothetical protein